MCDMCRVTSDQCTYHVKLSNGLQILLEVFTLEMLAIGLHALPLGVQVEGEVVVHVAGKRVDNATYTLDGEAQDMLPVLLPT